MDQAVAIGGGGGDAEGGGIGMGDAAVEDLLRAIPGVGEKGYRAVMRSVGGVRELCALSLAEVQVLLGTEPGKKCHDFLHRNLAS